MSDKKNILRPAMKAMDDTMVEINSSLAVDKELYQEDIDGSIAHATMLGVTGIIKKGEADKIIKGLETIKDEITKGQFQWRMDLEDIHINIENRLHEIIGANVAGKLHTARSRNDQVMTDSKLWLKKKINLVIKNCQALRRTIINIAEQHIDTIMVGYTHLQVAQVISFAHHLLAYYDMFSRDQQRFVHTLALHDDCPLGSAALAGTSFPIDRQMTAQALGFAKPSTNAMDAVASRDFFMNFLSDSTIHGIHLSRLAEELVLWSSPHFGYITLSDEWSASSSIMPQKKNPDSAELVRAKSAVLLSHFQRLGGVVKSLPLAYSKDLQEDKICIFDSYQQINLMQRAMDGILSTMTINKDAMKKVAEESYATATDLADYLVKEQALDFRTAYGITAKLVSKARELRCPLHQLPHDIIHDLAPELDQKQLAVLTAEHSLAIKQSYGGTGKEFIASRLAEIKKTL